MQKVCVMGLGYIGLPTASVLATNGLQVIGVDVRQEVVDTVNQGRIHIEEPGLHTMVKAATGSGNLRASTTPEKADAFIIAVPTPLTETKKADLSYVIQATEAVVPYLEKGSLVILESTSPPGTCCDILKPILERSGLKVGRDLYLAHCPERVLPGRIMIELIENDRIVGGYDQASAERARDLYAQVVNGEIFLTDVTTAEMVKILENTYRDVNIALANETALLCEKLGIDFWEAARLASRHPRVKILNAGPGVGGHCISVDPWFLVERLPEEAKLIRLARERTDDMPHHVMHRTWRLLAGVADAKVAALGLAYKGNVDDVRESPAIHVVGLLQGEGLHVSVCDPHVNPSDFKVVDIEAALTGADCVLLLTDHDEFRAIDPARAAELVRTPILFDTRHALDHAAWRAAGFEVHVLGSGK
ncbi:MAG: nucleotide sugar dehydrogenase [Candidatus Hydrogenedentes bacterium]|nr:nucleotide sugar dehydrogenase [Candidatus Hydrogenedentota bacterium]